MDWWLLAQATVAQGGGIQIDWSISIGQIISGFIAGLLAIMGAYGAGMKLYHAFDLRMTKIENNLTDHGNTLTTHSETMKEHEGRMIELMQDVARLMGLNGYNGTDRRRNKRT